MRPIHPITLSSWAAGARLYRSQAQALREQAAQAQPMHRQGLLGRAGQLDQQARHFEAALAAQALQLTGQTESEVAAAREERIRREKLAAREQAILASLQRQPPPGMGTPDLFDPTAGQTPLFDQSWT
jgi:hypothetical protein